MRVFSLFKNRVLIAAAIVVACASLTRADQNDKNKDNNRGDNRSSSGSSSRATNSGPSNNGPSIRSLSNGAANNSSSHSSNNQNVSRGNDSSNSSRVTRGSSSKDSDNGARIFQSGNNRGRASGDANVGDAGQARAFSKQNNSDKQSQQGNAQSNAKDAANAKQTVINNRQGSQKIQSTRPSDDQVRNFLQLKNNENTRIAENDDHKNKGDNGQGGRNQNNGNNNGNNGRQPQGGNPGSKNGGQANNGQNQNGQGQGNVQGNNGPQFKRGDFNGKDSNHDKNSDKDFKIGDHPNNGDHRNDGKHDDHATVKDLFDHNKGVGNKGVGDSHGDNHGVDRKFHDRDFHGNETAKVEFNKWNNVWKGKTGNGKDNRDWSGKWRSGDRFLVADSVRHDFLSHHDFHDSHHVPFAANWWSGNHNHGWGFWGDYAVHRHRPWYWWNWSTGPELTSFCGFGWSTPYYWDYGPGEYLYCNDGMVYVNGRMYEPASVFYAQTVRMIDQAPLLDADAAAEADWMPLGVFAVTPDGSREPAMLVQLAITKAGILGGTATDQQAGVSFNIQGTVDKNSQRAVWSYVDANNQRIVMESSINNLTQNESTGLIHYNANDQKVVVFVRLPDPNAQGGELPGPGPGDAGAGVLIPPASGQLPPPQEQ